MVIDYGRNQVKITLDANYAGDLRRWERHNTLPQGVYFDGGAADVLRDAAFLRFLEVATHWDYDGDGQYDCDQMLRDLNEACEDWGVEVEPLVRPTSSFMTYTFMRFVPPPPTRHIKYTFGQLRPHYRLWQFMLTVPGLAIFICMVLLQNKLLPFMRYSPLTGWLWFSDRYGFIRAIALLVGIITIKKAIVRPAPAVRKSRIRYTYGLFNGAAVDEEQQFREGSEDWTWFGRLRSNLVFGLVHQSNLFYPLASILPLSFGGWIFMRVYLHFMKKTNFRRSAVFESGVTHRVWNFNAQILIAAVVAAATGGLIWSSIMSVVAFFASYMLLDRAGDKLYDRIFAKRQSARQYV